MYIRINRENNTACLYDKDGVLRETLGLKGTGLLETIDALKRNRERKPSLGKESPFSSFLSSVFPEEFKEEKEKEKDPFDQLVEELSEFSPEPLPSCGCYNCTEEATTHHLVFVSSVPPPSHLYTRYNVVHISVDNSQPNVSVRLFKTVESLRRILDAVAMSGVSAENVKVCVMTDPLLTYRIISRLAYPIESVYLNADGTLTPFSDDYTPWIY